MGDVEGLAVEAIRQQHVRCQRVLQREALRQAVLRAQDDEGRVLLGTHAGHDELLIEVAKAPSAPAETSPAPGGHAVEVRDLLYALERSELRSEPGGTLDVAVDGDLDALGLRRKAEGEVHQSEAREVVDFDLTGRQGRGLSHAAGLPGRGSGHDSPIPPMSQRPYRRATLSCVMAARVLAGQSLNISSSTSDEHGQVESVCG